MANRSASASATKAVLIMVVAGTMIFTLPTVMVLTVGMIPTFIAYATDRRKEKYKTVSVGSLNFVGGFASACYSLDKRPFFRYGVFSSLRPVQLADGFRVVISRLDYILGCAVDCFDISASSYRAVC